MASVFHLGSWKSIIEMEDHLTLRELDLLYKAYWDRVESERRWTAAINGHEYGTKEDKVKTAFDEIKERAMQETTGMTEEERVFNFVGIKIETDDDEEEG